MPFPLLHPRSLTPPPAARALSRCLPAPQYNVFGITFQQVLSEESDTIRWDEGRDGFDAAVVFVHKDSVPTFMTELKIRLGQQARRDAADAADAAARQREQQGRGEEGGEEGVGDGEGSQGGGKRERRGRGGGGGVDQAVELQGEEDVDVEDVEEDI